MCLAKQGSSEIDGLDTDEDEDEDEADTYVVAVRGATPLYASLACLVASYLAPVVVLRAMKGKSERDATITAHTVPRKWLFAHSPVMEMLSQQDPWVDVLHVTSDTLAELVRFVRAHHDRVPPSPQNVRSLNLFDCCPCKWDAMFITDISQKSTQKVYDLLLLANKYAMQSLLHLCCAAIASLIKVRPFEILGEVLAPTAPGSSRDKSGENPESTVTVDCGCGYCFR